MSPDNSQYDLYRYHAYGSVQPSYLKHIQLLLEELISRHRSGTIVDAGAGRGIYCNYLTLEGFKVVAQDTSPSAFDSIGDGVTPHYGDIRSLHIYPNIVLWHAKDVVVDHIPLEEFFSTARQLSPVGALVMLTTLDRYQDRELNRVPWTLGFEAIKKDSWTPTSSEELDDWYNIKNRTRRVIIYQRSR